MAMIKNKSGMKSKSGFMRGKSGFLRTIEVLVALFITIIFLVLIIPRYYTSDIDIQDQNIIEPLREDDAFRNAVLSGDNATIDTKIRQHLSAKYEFVYTSSADQNAVANNLPAKRVFSESAYFTANSTYYSPKVFRIYYWSR